MDAASDQGWEERQTVSINLRVPRAQKELIDRAADLTHKNRTQFILDAATRAAEDALLDQRFFVLSGAVYDQFLRQLEVDPADDQGVADLIARTAPWDE